MTTNRIFVLFNYLIKYFFFNIHNNKTQDYNEYLNLAKSASYHIRMCF